MLWQQDGILHQRERRRYFDPKTGVMSKAKKRVDGNWYYFSKIDGVAKGGWLNEDGRKRYFDPKTLIMVTGTRVIDGKTIRLIPRDF